jgi:hypothetical protein
MPQASTDAIARQRDLIAYIALISAIGLRNLYVSLCSYNQKSGEASIHETNNGNNK